MKNIERQWIPAKLAATDVEIEAAAERLSLKWTPSALRQRPAGTSQILQKLAHGRSHAVALEIKRSQRRVGGSSSPVVGR